MMKPKDKECSRTAWLCLTGLVLLFILPALHTQVMAFDYELLKASLQQRSGNSGARVLDQLNTTIIRAQQLDKNDKLERINDFFNNAIRFETDQEIWQVEDYWSTPLETIAVGRGDCEDIAIAKYFALKAAGISVAELRLVYVRATINNFTGQVQQAHMVLAWYSSPTAEPLILDNLVGRIRPAGQRRDLQPIFSFNSEAVWTGAAATARRESGSGQLTRWQDLQVRSRREGFW